MLQKEVNEIKNRAVASAKNASCEQIIRDFNLPTIKTGHQLYFPCPKCGCSEKKKKNSLNTQSNMYYCFGCAEGGGSPKLYSLLTGMSYMDSCLAIAYKSGDITYEEYSPLVSSVTYRNKAMSDNKTYKKFESDHSTNAGIKAPPKVSNLVYSHLIRMKELALNEEGYLHLSEKRKLSNEEIREGGYFSYDTPLDINKLIRSIRNDEPEFNVSMLNGVAGFYFLKANKDDNKGWWQIIPPFKGCLGIPIKDANGNITALQMRNLHAGEKNAKYFFVSSAHAKDERGTVCFGSSPNTPVNVKYPKELKNSVIYVGEGIFKMNELSEEGSIVLSVQGVNSYSEVALEIENIQKKNLRDSNSYSIRICYDMDMYNKVEVIKALKGFYYYLKKNFPSMYVEVMVWDRDLGKGVDDMKFTCKDSGMDFHREIVLVSADQFIKIIDKAVKEADTYFPYTGTDKHRQTDEWRERFFEKFYKDRIEKIIKASKH